ncbi:MAG: hypothetical protein ACRYFA_11825 [Janthinobacterium lividum]
MIAEQATALRILMNDDLYLTTEDLQKETVFIPITLSEPEPNILIEEPIVPEFKYIGKNLKNFLILTNETILENHLKALENTLLRKQMSLEDVAIVDYAAYNAFSFEQINASFMAQKIVCFGLKPEVLDLPEATVNHINTYPNYQILYTFSFSEMLGDKEKTKAFWEPMKIL